MQTRFGLRPLTADPTSISAIEKSALSCCPFIWIGLVILRAFRLVLAPAFKLPILGHGVEMAMSPQLGGLYRSWLKERPEIISHGASKTKTRMHLTIRFGIEPDFVDKFIFHWNALLREISCDKIAGLRMRHD